MQLSLTHTLTHTHTHTHTQTLSHTHNHVHTLTHTHTHVYTHIHVHTHTHTYLTYMVLAQDLLALHKRGAEMVSVTILTGKDSQTHKSAAQPIQTRFLRVTYFICKGTLYIHVRDMTYV